MGSAIGTKPKCRLHSALQSARFLPSCRHDIAFKSGNTASAGLRARFRSIKAKQARRKFRGLCET